jgi:hypothetical protein
VALGNITLLTAEKQKAPAHHMQGLEIKKASGLGWLL